MVSAIKQCRTGIGRFAAAEQAHRPSDETHRSPSATLSLSVIGRCRAVATPLAGRPSSEHALEETAARQSQRPFGTAGGINGMRTSWRRARVTIGHRHRQRLWLSNANAKMLQ